MLSSHISQADILLGPGGVVLELSWEGAGSPAVTVVLSREGVPCSGEQKNHLKGSCAVLCAVLTDHC